MIFHELNISFPERSYSGVIEDNFLKILTDTVKLGDSRENVAELSEVPLLFQLLFFFFLGFSLILCVFLMDCILRRDLINFLEWRKDGLF